MSNALFSSHTSFKYASTVIKYELSDTKCGLFEFASFNMDATQLFTNIAPLLSIISTCNLPSNSIESADVMMFENILTALQNHPSNSTDKIDITVYNELELENATKKQLLGGKLDIVLAQSKNGLPSLEVQEPGQRKRLSVSAMYCTAIVEAKQPSVPSSGYTENDFQPFCQPIIEILAMSQACSFENNSIPLVLVYGSRYRFRPLLYFNYEDVLLTTSHAIPYISPDGEGVSLQGMFLLFLLCYKNLVEFNAAEIAKLPRTGWKDAISKRAMGNPYADTILVVEKTGASKEPAQNLQPPILRSIEEYIGKKRSASQI